MKIRKTKKMLNIFQLVEGWQNPGYGSMPGTTIKSVTDVMVTEEEGKFYLPSGQEVESYWSKLGPIHYVSKNTLYLQVGDTEYLSPEERRTLSAGDFFLLDTKKGILERENRRRNTHFNEVRFL